MFMQHVMFVNVAAVSLVYIITYSTEALHCMQALHHVVSDANRRDKYLPERKDINQSLFWT